MKTMKEPQNQIKRNLISRLCRKVGSIWLSRKRAGWQKRIKNKDFSIVCSTCVGGVLYHDLGMQFLSPTINMFMSNLDFIKFACDLKYYCSLDLRFIESDYVFPVAMLGDIQLNFNHHNNAEEASFDWNRRKERINFDNLYLIFYYREGYSLEQIREIEKAPCKRVAVLTHKPLPLDYAVYIKGNGTTTQNFLEKDRFGIMSIEKEWDFVSWLNGD